MHLHKGTLDGRRILSGAGVESMLGNQIGDWPIPRLKAIAPPITAHFELFPAKRKSHSMAFMRFAEDLPGMRDAGSQDWAGIHECQCRFDPKAAIAGVPPTQSLPLFEPR
jgi:hypothetical protein